MSEVSKHLQDSSVHGHALDCANRKANGLRRSTILTEPDHDFVRGIGSAPTESTVRAKEHIHTHVGVQASGRQFGRSRDGLVLIANSIVPVDVEVERGEGRQLDGQGVDAELRIGESVHGRVACGSVD